MTRRSIARAAPVGCALALLAVLAPLAAAQDQPTKAGITITAYATSRGGTVTASASGAATLTIGESATRYVFADANGNPGQSRDDPAGITLAGGGGGRGAVAGGVISSPPSNPPRFQYDHLWQADVKAVSVGIDTVTFDLDWKRSDRQAGTLQVVHGDHRTITLRQGEKHMLDFIACPPDAYHANVFVELQAQPVEEPNVANVALAYDLWLVHEAPGRAPINRHAVVTGVQGQKVEFNFAPVPLQLDAAAPSDADSVFRLVVAGTITGRLRPDGSIDIALQSTRREMFPTGGPPVGFGEGTKTFAAKPDEATSVALPPNQGRSGWPVDRSFRLRTPKPGVTLTPRADDGWLRVELKPFFEGTTTTIIVTVRRPR